MVDNEFNQYSSASVAAFREFGSSPSERSGGDVQWTVQSAEVPHNRPLAKTSADWTVRCTPFAVGSGWRVALRLRA